MIIIAAFTSNEMYQGFLSFIGSVFAPMFAILLTEYFIMKKENIDNHKLFDWKNIILWAAGVIIYQIFLQFDLILESTFPVMIIIGLICITVKNISKK